MGYNAYEHVDSMPANTIDELHQGGFTPDEDHAVPGAELWVDTHRGHAHRPRVGVHARLLLA